MATQFSFEEFKPSKLQVPPNRPKSTKGFPVEFELRKIMVYELGSFVEGFGDPMTQTSTPKSMEEVAIEVMKVDNAIQLFQTMAIMR